MSYFEDGDTVPPPFNMVPTGKTFSRIIKCGKTGRQTRSLIVCTYFDYYCSNLNDTMKDNYYNITIVKCNENIMESERNKKSGMQIQKKLIFRSKVV